MVRINILVDTLPSEKTIKGSWSLQHHLTLAAMLIQSPRHPPVRDSPAQRWSWSTQVPSICSQHTNQRACGQGSWGVGKL